MKRSQQGFPIVVSDRTLYRYMVTKHLGEGGFGEVFQARIRSLRLNVALKRFKLDPGGTRAGRERWAREASTHGSMSHPNILQVLDAFKYEGFLYLATELATGSLDNCTPPQGWDELEVMRAGMHVSSALHYMHTAWTDEGPLIHRDVTPNNIFYFQEASLFKIGDFGIAKALDGEDGVAVTQIANWSFVAPELVKDGFSVPQSDLFQLGLVLYFMAQGESAIPTNLSVADRKRSVVGGAAYRAASDAPFESEGLQGCIKKLLLRDMDKRYQSASEVFADLRAVHREARRKDDP